jgi:hypothetical protein
MNPPPAASKLKSRLVDSQVSANLPGKEAIDFGVAWNC